MNGLKNEFLDFFFSETAKRKSNNNALGFNDLLLNVQEALKGKSGEIIRSSLLKRFRAALIDEFQDTDYIQYDIFTTAFKGVILS